MKRIPVQPRQGWLQHAESLGFHITSVGGKPYWAEAMQQPHYYQFSLSDVVDFLEDPATRVHQLFMQLVERVCNGPDSDALFTKLRIPQAFWQAIRASWNRKELQLYGRMDLSYDHPVRHRAVVLEYNAQTPTAVYEAGAYQWLWKEKAAAQGLIPEVNDQFNSVHEALIERFKQYQLNGSVMHFASTRRHVEDEATVRYLEDLAQQAGLRTKFVFLESIGDTDNGLLVDAEDELITDLFMLYPWEFAFEDAFGKHLPKLIEENLLQFVQPVWTAIISNKAALVLLSEMFPMESALLYAAFDDGGERAQMLKRAGLYCRKPILSREGANVTLVSPEGTISNEGGYGKEGFILQELATLPNLDGAYPVIGVWIVGDKAVGMGIREDDSPITTDAARFMPHIIV